MQNCAGPSSSHGGHGHSSRYNMDGWLTLACGTQPNQAPEQFFMCPYCPKTFPSSQALGGHQNLHRRERKFRAREYGDQVNMPTRAPPPLNLFPPSYTPTASSVAPSLWQGPLPNLKLTLGRDAGATRPNYVPSYDYPNYLERRLGLRNDETLVEEMSIGDSEGGDDDNISSEATLTCTELRDMEVDGSGDDSQTVESGSEVSSKELDLTLKL